MASAAMKDFVRRRLGAMRGAAMEGGESARFVLRGAGGLLVAMMTAFCDAPQHSAQCWRRLRKGWRLVDGELHIGD